ncbi:WxL protein host-binding domain-containing protein [Chryseobacterium sp. CBSDS_008]|uniref:WxL protein host-binding domain-containing protein n=1 Tax=Chryseobacterium sp. CBSDS_008 TaxID=3415265 RepID=UPI003CF161D5
MIKRILLLITLILQFSFLHAGIVILNGLTHSYKIENGKVYKGKVAIENTSSNPQSVKLFLQDYTYHADGTINYTALRTNSRSNGDWIKLNTNLVTLKGKEKTEIFYEITVPNQAMDPGSYWSIIIVEPVEEIKPSDKKPGVSITSVIRYAIQVITDFETERARPDLKFESVKVEKQEGKQTAKIAIANNGNLYCKPTAVIEIYNRKTGEKVGTYSSLTMGLLPNTSKTFFIDISKVPPDKYRAAIIATDEEENAFALNVELEVKND